MLNMLDSIIKLEIHDLFWLKIIEICLNIIIIFMIAGVVFTLTRIIVSKIVRIKLYRSRLRFLKVMTKHKVQNLVSHLVFASVIWLSGRIVMNYHGEYLYYEAIFLNKFALYYLFITCVLVVTRIISSINTYYEDFVESARDHPINSYVKVINLCVWVFSVVLLLSLSLDMSPITLLTGVGAASAVFLLIFRDSLLGIMSSIQATASNMVRIGDRISIESDNVDGQVLDISINTVKVKNADNTTVYIPTYMLTSKVVKNWRTLEDYGARRIKRAIYLDISTIELSNNDLSLKIKNSAIGQYLSDDVCETNLEYYRVYLTKYLLLHKGIDKNYRVLVRHLDLTPNGLPLEIYVYTNVIELSSFEDIQSQIFEHAIASLPIFDLKIYQT